MLETPILGIIPEDETVKISQVLKNAVVYTHPKSRAARNYIEISKRLLGDDYKEPEIKKGFWARLFGK